MKTTLIALALSLTAGCSTVTINVITGPSPKAATTVQVPQGTALQAALTEDSSGMVWCNADGTVCGRRR